MGSCVSCKADKEAYAYTTSPAIHAYRKYHSMENGRTTPTGQSDAKGLVKRNTPYSRGQATLFGFKRRPSSSPGVSSIPVLDNASTPSPTVVAANNHSHTSSHESLNSISPIQSGKSSPKLARPKKDVDGNNTVRTNRFGFRTPTPAAITNKVGDSNSNTIPSPHIITHTNQEYKNVVNTEKLKAKGSTGGRLPVPVQRETSIPRPNTATPEAIKTKIQRTSIPKPEVHHEQSPASRFTLQTAHLPKPQYPIRLSSVDADVKKTSKIAKTAANNSTRKVCQGSGEESSSKEGSVNEDSGIGSHHSTAMSNGETDTLHGVELLESSPTFGHRRNQNIQKPRVLEMIVRGQRFDVRDLKDDDSSADDPNVITEISLISLPRSNQRINNGNNLINSTGLVSQRTLQYQRQIPNNSSNVRHDSLSTPSSDESHTDEGIGREEGEEKVFQDSSKSEKSLLDKGLVTPGSMEGEDWGHGEAMAEEFSSSSDDGHNNLTFSTSSLQMNIPGALMDNSQKGRPVILTIEDPLFAAFAAEASSSLLDDEKSPVDSLISSPPTSTVSEDEDQQRSLLQDDDSKHTDCVTGAGEAAMQRSANTLSPESPGTPTNASNSLSLSEGRDFLIDDEIADQPGLTFDDGGSGPADLGTSSAGCSSLLLSITENTTLVDSPPKPVARRVLAASSVEGSPSPARGRRVSRTGSVDTLSPCESIASDDLMLDFERSEGSVFDCTVDSRLDGSVGALQTLDESSLEPEFEDLKDEDLKELSNAVGSFFQAAGVVTNRSRLLRSRPGSTPDSARSLEAKPRPSGSPLKPPRQLSGSECEDGGVYLDRHTYHSICQDIVNHKTMLLKLMRLLQQAETLNPFDSSLKNGLFYNLASTEAPSTDSEGIAQANCQNPQEEIADLRRQVEFLQQQLAEKQHTVQLLQIQMTKYSNAESAASSNGPVKETCNAATQTERVRPVSAGPSLLQSLPSENNMGPLVSSSDMWGRRKQQQQQQQQQVLPGETRVPIASKLPAAARTWKRSSLPQMVQQPCPEPARRLTLSGSTLPKRMLDSHTVQPNKT